MTIQALDLSPTDGTPITADTPIVFDVRTSVASPFLRVIVALAFPGLGYTELVYSRDPAVSAQDPFERPYSAGSSVVAVVDAGWLRYRFTIQRNPVWPDSPELLVYAFNTAGEEL